MKAFLSFLLLASIAVNVGFLTGCASFHDLCYGSNPCKHCSAIHVSPYQLDAEKKKELVKIADLLGIETTRKEASDLSSDICYVLDRKENVPGGLSPSEMSEIQDLLSTSHARKIADLNQFVEELQGKRVIVIEPER